MTSINTEYDDIYIKICFSLALILLSTLDEYEYFVNMKWYLPLGAMLPVWECGQLWGCEGRGEGELWRTERAARDGRDQVLHYIILHFTNSPDRE